MIEVIGMKDEGWKVGHALVPPLWLLVIGYWLKGFGQRLISCPRPLIPCLSFPIRQSPIVNRQSQTPIPRPLSHGFSLILPLFLLLPFSVSAQEQLTLQQAMELALANNFEVRLARTEAFIASNNATVGNAGMLPSIGIEAGQNNRVESIGLEFLNGEELERNGAGTEAFNAAAQLNWTLFDGLRMFTTYRQLKILEQQGETQVRLAMENTLHGVVRGYFDLVRLRYNMRQAEEAMELSQERMRLAEGKLAAGRESRVELLQAQVARNNDAAALMELEQELFRARTDLNLLLGRAAETLLEVTDDTIALGPAPDFAKLRNSLFDQNPEMGITRTSQEVALLQLQGIRRERWPVVDANVGYGFARSQSEGGFVVSNRTYGVNYGLGARFNLFNGLDRHRRQRNAEAEAEIGRLQLEQLDMQLQGELVTTYTEHSGLLRMIALEQENLAAATENTGLAMERYRQGMLSGIELREVQLNRTMAATRLSNLLFRAKVTEALLYRLAGDVKGMAE